MPKKSARRSSRARQSVRKAQNQRISVPKLFGSIVILLILGSIALMLHRSPDNHLRLSSLAIVPSLPLFPSPTPLPAVDHLKLFVPTTQEESTAYVGMVRYLDTFKTPNVRDGMSLAAYTVDSISNCSFITDSIQCNVEFSLLPNDKSSQSIGIDNGRMSTDGWIIEKHGVVLLRLSANNLYEVWSIADGYLPSK